MARLSIKIEQRTFDIDVNDSVYHLLLSKVREDLDVKNNNTLSDLLKAYLSECYKNIAKDKKIETLIKKLDDN